MGDQIPVTENPDFEEPENLEGFRELEKSLLDEEDWRGLVQLYRRCADEFAGDGVDFEQLAEHLEELAEHLDRDDEIAQVQLWLGDLYAGELEETQAAKQAYRAAFVHDTSNTRPLEKARQIYRDEENDQLILKLYELEEQVTETDAEQSLLRTRKAQTHAEYREDFELARELLEDALALDSDNELAQRTLEIYEQERRLEDAIDEMIQLARDAAAEGDDPMAARLFYKAGWLEWFREGGSRDRARAIAERAKKSAEDEPDRERAREFHDTIEETEDWTEVDAIQLGAHPSAVDVDFGGGEDASTAPREASEATREERDDEEVGDESDPAEDESAAEAEADGRDEEDDASGTVADASEPEASGAGGVISGEAEVAAAPAQQPDDETDEERAEASEDAEEQDSEAEAATDEESSELEEPETIENYGVGGAADPESFYDTIPAFDGDYEEALEAWEEDNSDLSAFVAVRDWLREHGQWEELAEKLEATVKYLRKEEGESQMMAELARLYWKRIGDFEEAEHFYKRLKLLDNDHPDVAAFYEEYYERNEQWRRLFSHLKSRAEKADDPAERREYVRRRAEVAEDEMESPEKAIDVWKQYLRETEDRDARVELERLYEEYDKWEGLVDFLKDEVRRLEEEGDETVDRRIEILTRMVDLYEDEIGHEVMAINTLREIVELDPENAGAFERLRDMLEESRRWKDLVEALSDRAEWYEDRNDSQRAADLYAEMADVLEEDLKHTSRAVEALERALEAAPDRDELRRRLASIYESKRDYESLYELRTDELELYEGTERLQRLYDLRELVQGKLRDPERAIPILEEIVELDTGNLEALEELEEVYRKRENWEELSDVLRRKTEMLSDVDARIDAFAEAAAIQQDHLENKDRAVDLWERVLDEEPDHDEAIDRLANLYVERGDFEELEELFRERARFEQLYDMLDVAAEDAAIAEQRELYRTMAQVADRQLGDLHRTIESLEELLELAEEPGKVARELAERYRDAGEPDREIQAMKVVLENAEDEETRLEVTDRLSRLEEERGAFDDALSWQAEAIEIDPGREEALERAEMLADSAADHGTLVELLDAIAEGLEDEQRQAEFWRRIGRIESDKLGRVDDAIEHLERVREVRPEDLETLERLAELYDQAERYEEFAERQHEVVELRREQTADERDLVEPMSHIAEVRLEHLDDPRGALEMFMKILEVAPEHLPSVQGMARFAREQGDWRKFTEWRERELELLPTSDIDRRIEIQYDLAEAYRQHLEAYEEALRYYREILEVEPDDPDAIDGAKELLDRPEVARDAALLLEPIFRDLARWEELADALEARLDAADDAYEQLDLLDDLVGLYRNELRDEERAFDRAVDQFELEPEREEIWQRLEELAASLDRYDELEELYASATPEDAADAADAQRELLRRLAQIRRAQLDRPAEAVDALERLYDWDPEDPEVADALESLYRTLDRADDLVALLEERAQTATTDEETIDRLVEVARLSEDVLEDVAGAIDAYREILELDPVDETAFNGLERLYRRRERWVDLEELYAERIRQVYDPDEQRARRLDLAQLRIEELDEFDGALQILEELLAEDPGDQEVVAALESLEERLAEREDDRSDLRLRIAEALEPVYRERRDAERLVDVLETRLAGTDDRFDRLDLLDELTRLRVQRLGDRESGFEHLVEAVRLDPEDEERREKLVTLGRRLERIEDVVETLEESLERADEFARAPINRIIGELSRRELEDPERAIEAYERILEFDEADEEALRALERLYEETERSEDLAENLRRQTRYAEPDRRAELLERVGGLERQVLDRPDRAIEAYHELLELEPDSRVALDVLEELYRDRENWIDLSDILRRKADAVADVDETIETLTQLAHVYRDELGDVEEAIAVWERVRKLDSTNTQALEALEELFEETERWPDLAEILRQRLMTVEEDDEARDRIELKLADLLRTELYEGADAIDLYRSLLGRDPTNAEAVAGLEALAEDPTHAERIEDDLVQYYNRVDDWESLEELYERRRDQVTDPEKRSRYSHHVAQARLRGGERDAAFEALADAWRLAPEEETYRSELFEMAEEEDRWEAFAEVLRDVLPEVRDSERRADLHLRLAAIEREELDAPVEAEDHYREALSIDDSRLSTFEALDELLVDQQRWRDLTELLDHKYEVLGRTDPEEATDLLERIATIHEEKLDDPFEATTCFERVLEADPSNEAALEELRRLYREQERWEELAEHLEHALEITAEPDDAVDLHFERAEILQDQLYRHREAVEHYERILDFDIEHDRSVEALEELLEEHPDLAPEVTPVLERAYRYREQWERVFDISTERASVLDDPAERRDVWRRAAEIARERLEDPDRAYEVTEHLFRADPGDESLRREIRRLAALSERWAELADLYGEVVDESLGSGTSGRVEVLCELGEIYEARLESIEEARSTYERAVAEDPAPEQAVDALERVLTRLGDWVALADFYRERAEQSADVDRVKAWYEKLARLEEVVRYDVDGAIEAYYDILEVDPEDRHAHSAILRLLAYDNRWYDLADRYREELERVESEERRLQIKFRLAELTEGELDDVDDAIRLYREILEERPHHRDTLRALEGLRRDLAKREGVWREYRLTILDELEERYETPQDWRRLVELLESRRELVDEPHRQAELLVEEAELIDTHAVDDVERVPALSRLAEAFALEPQDDELWVRFVEFADDLSIWTRVPVVLLRPLRASSEPEHQAALLVALGDIYSERLDDRESAIAAYQQAVEIRGDEESLDRLEELYSEAELWEPLVDVLEMRLGRLDDPEQRRRILERLGTIYDEILERPAEAVTYYEDLRAEQPDELRYYDALESIYERTGMYEQLEDLLLSRLDLVEAQEERARVLRRVATIQDEYLENAEAAIETYRELQETDESDEQVVDALVRLYERTQRWPELLEALEMKREFSDSLEAVNRIDFRRGHILLEKIGDPSRAFESFEAVLERDESFEEAREAMEDLATRYDTDPRAAEYLQDLYRSEQNWTALEELFEEQLEEVQDPDRRGEIYMELAQLHEEQLENRHTAFAMLGRAFRELPDKVYIRHELDRLSSRLENPEELLAMYQDALDAEMLDPDVAQELHKKAGTIAIDRLDDVEQATDHARSALELDEYDDDTLELLDRLYQQQHDWDRLAEILERRLELADADALNDIRFRLGYLHEVMFEDYERALDYYREVIVDEPDHGGVIDGLERMVEDEYLRREIAELLEPAYRELEAWGKLGQLYELQLEVIEEPTRQAEVNRKLAALNIDRLDRPDVGFAHLSRALRADPHDADLQDRLEELAVEGGRYGEIVALYEDLMDELTDPVRVLDLAESAAAWAHEELEEPERAARIYRKVLELEPEHEQALSALESIARELDRDEDLVEVLERKSEMAYESDEQRDILVELGQVCTDLERFEQAADAYQQALLLDESDTEVMRQLVGLYDVTERYDDLVDVLERLANYETAPEQLVRLYNEVGRYSENFLDDPDRAIRAYREVLEHDPGNDDALESLEELYREQERWNPLENILEEALERAEEEGDADEIARVCVELGTLTYERFGDVDPAVEWFNRALEIESGHPDVIEALEEIYQQEARWDDLRELLDDQLREAEEDARRAELLTEMGRINLEYFDDAQVAEARLDEALEIVPDDPYALEVREDLCREREDWEGLLGVYERQLQNAETDEEEIRVRTKRAELQAGELGAKDEAIGDYMAILELEPLRESALNRARELYQETDNPHGTYSLLQHEAEHVDDEQERVDLYLEMADLAREQLSSPEFAVDALELAHEERPEDMDIVDRLIQARLDAGQTEEAEPLLEEAITMLEEEGRDEEAARFQHLRGKLFEERGEHERAVEAYEAVFRMNDSFIPNLLSLGKLAYRMENWEKAKNTFQKLLLHQMKLESDQQKVDVYYHLGLIREQMGDERRAKDMFNRALSLDPDHEPSQSALEELDL